jgi:hypothetical protein
MPQSKNFPSSEYRIALGSVDRFHYGLSLRTWTPEVAV